MAQPNKNTLPWHDPNLPLRKRFVLLEAELELRDREIAMHRLLAEQSEELDEANRTVRDREADTQMILRRVIREVIRLIEVGDHTGAVTRLNGVVEALQPRKPTMKIV